MALIQELNKRKIWQALAVYLGGAWVTIEAIHFLTVKYGWSPLFEDVLITLVIFGLPAVLIFTWFQSIPEKKKFTKKEIVLYSLNVCIAAYVVINVILSSPDKITTGNEVSDLSLVVLPLANLSTNQEDQFFADGITEAIRTHLGKISTLKVTSRNSSDQYRDSPKSAPQISNDLGARYILEGSVQKYENKIRINIQLIDGLSDSQVWTDLYDRMYDDVLAIQSEIAIQIANQLKLQLSPQETQRISRKATDNMVAYDLFLKGQQMLRYGNGSENDLDSAILFFQKAIDLEPDFSLAYAGLADAYMFRVIWGRSPSNEVIPVTMKLVMKALELDNDLGECYESLGVMYLFQLDYGRAEEYLKKAIALSPNHLESYWWLANTYVITGDLQKVTEYYEKVFELDPMTSMYRGFYANIYYNYHKFDESVKIVESVSDDKSKDFVLWHLANNYLELGDPEKAIATYHKRSAGTYTNWTLGYAYSKAGRTEEARKILDYLLEKRKAEYVPPYMIAVSYVGLGDFEKALDWLEKGFDEGPSYVYILGMRSDPKVESIENTPRFKALLDKMGIERYDNEM